MSPLHVSATPRVQTFDLTRATDYYGHFSCPAAEEAGSVYGLTSTKLYYETYHVSEVSSRHREGDDIASAVFRTAI